MKIRICALALLAAPIVASAHVVLEQQVATAGSYYKGVFRVGHGCEGSATVALTVTLPEPMASVKPMVKPGWTVSTRSEKLAQPLMNHGKPVTEAVVEVSWRGGPLADAHYDEFALMMKLPDAAGRRWFKVTQLCEQGANEWSQVPAEGQTTRDLKMPAAVLDIQPAAGHAHH
jgi:periplasmic copper chaperone A